MLAKVAGSNQFKIGTGDKSSIYLLGKGENYFPGTIAGTISGKYTIYE